MLIFHSKIAVLKNIDLLAKETAADFEVLCNIFADISVITLVPRQKGIYGIFVFNNGE